MELPTYSMGVGDRFAHQGRAQLDAIQRARESGREVCPVWNKSHREHELTGTGPESVRREADAAVKEMDWDGPYFVDADHVGLDTVDAFLDCSDYFTIDVADFIGQDAPDQDVEQFVDRYADYAGTLQVPGLDRDLEVSRDDIRTIAGRYLLAVREAGKVYRHIESVLGAGEFVTELSMDETDAPQTPVEMFFILAAVADEGIPAQAIAPRFSGSFNKGVDYEGDVGQFRAEFEADVCVLAHAADEFGLPENLKLSIHSGSDKFSIYGPMREVIAEHDAGLHLKTAGTTWLEELTGLALAGGDGLRVMRRIYSEAYSRLDELREPYLEVTDIEREELPSPDDVDEWTGEQVARALRHDQSCGDYNPDFRQTLHLAYKVAAEMGDEFTAALEKHEDTIAPQVTENILERHLEKVFPAE